MRKKLALLFVAVMALPSLCAASDTIKDDSVKVIKSPEQVTITKRDGLFRLNVDGNETDGKDAGTYIAMNPAAETVTPGAYEIVEAEDKTALVFTSNEGVITYILRNE